MKLVVAMQAVENASPWWPQPSRTVKSQLRRRFSPTAPKLTNIGVLRRSMA